MLNKREALAKELKVKFDDIEEAGEVFSVDGAEYQVFTEEEAQKAVSENIKDSLWAFNASFILGECELDLSGEDSLKTMQEKSCEGANDFILSLVEKTCGLEMFIDDAISTDGISFYL